MNLNNEKLAAWLQSMRTLCQPDDVVICDGSESEYDRMWDLLLGAGVAKKLNPELRPNSYLVRSDPADVARVGNHFFDGKEEQLLETVSKWLEGLAAP